MVNKTVILHISDLHFGIEKYNSKVAEIRENILGEFKKSYSSMISKNPDWAPDILVVSGDIAYDGSPEDYEKAEPFFNWITNKDLKNNKISKGDVVLCFGNHDVHANCMKIKNGVAFDHQLNDFVDRPEPNLDFEKYFQYNLDVNERYHRFEHIENFCERMGFVSLTSSSKRYKYAFGYCNVKGIDFISFNTEWDFWGAGDKAAKDTNVLRIGSNLCLKTMENFGNLFDKNPNPRFIVYHRPLTCLHKHEQYEPSQHFTDRDRRKVGNIIVRQSDVSLNGHTHSNAIIKKSTHTIVTAGSIHSDDTWNFSCNLIFVPKPLVEEYNECTVRLFKYYATLDHNTWKVNKNLNDKSFYIYRNEDFELVEDFVAAYDDWIENREKISREEVIEYQNKLIQLLGQLEDKIHLLLTIFGQKGLNEIRNELDEGRKLTIFQNKYILGKDSNSGPLGGGGSGATKSNNMDREKVKSPNDMSGEGYIPPARNKE